MLPAALLFWSIIGILISRYFYRHLAAWELYQRDWNDLLSKVPPISVAAVTAIGDEYLNPTPHQLGLEPVDIWHSVGGLEGIRRMRRNARIMIALAAYAQRWNFTESVIVKERMQQDALHLQRATLQVILRTVFRTSRNAGVLPGRAVFYLHDSVGAYHLMTKRLLTLYRTSHAGLYPRLAEVLGDGLPLRAA
jgi:hypothetical protein